MSNEKKVKDDEQRRFELLLSFHQQFAENQNHHQNVLFKLITVLVTVIVGYGYILHGHNVKPGYDNKELVFALIIAEFLLIIGFAVVCNMAYGFRRDQLVNFKIRNKYGIISTEGKCDNIFPHHYNPMHKFFKNGEKTSEIEIFNWQPEFHRIFSIALLIFQFSLIVPFCLKIDYFYSILIGFPTLLIIAIISVNVLYYFETKIEEIYEKQAAFDIKRASPKMACEE